MEFKMKKVIITFLCLLFPTGAFAGNAIKEITGYRNIKVNFSSTAESCDLNDTKKFTDHLAEKLAKLGIKQRNDSVVVARLDIGGESFGLIKGHCALGTELTFRTILKSDNIATDNSNVRKAVDRLGAFSVDLYNVDLFAVEARVVSGGGPEKRILVDEKVLEMIDYMANKIAEGKKG